jgi:hypothetical protein
MELSLTLKMYTNTVKNITSGKKGFFRRIFKLSVHEITPNKEKFKFTYRK